MEHTEAIFKRNTIRQSSRLDNFQQFKQGHTKSMCACITERSNRRQQQDATRAPTFRTRDRPVFHTRIVAVLCAIWGCSMNVPHSM